jgi:YjbE family integral membrane protein
MDISSPAFWIAVGQIIAIDILLGGDNAVVIALASRRLPDRQRRKAIFWGIFGAVAIRMVLIFFALQLLRVPFLKIGGGLLLLWIGLKLLRPESDGDHKIDASANLIGAVKTIIVADAVMSLDNVIGIAAAAKDELALVVFGLLVSVPIILWGSRFVLRLMDRFPFVIVAGAALLGWIAGDMIVHDVAVKTWLAPAQLPAWVGYTAGACGAALVVAVGKLGARAAAAPAQPVDLAGGRPQPDRGNVHADSAHRD